MERLRIVPRAIVRAGIIVAAAFLSSLSPASGAGPYTVPQVSKVTATVPAGSYTPEVHLVCLVRAETEGSQVSARQVCYSSLKPTPPPSLPILDFQPAVHQVLVGALIQDGGLLVPIFDCTELVAGAYAVSLALGIQLDKGGGAASGSAVLVTDTTAPFECDEGPGTETTEGNLTLTPLADDHDEDGDGCPDLAELGDSPGSGGLRDPFNPWDYFNPEQDGINRTTDIELVTSHYHHDKGHPEYSVNWDIDGVYLPGPSNWNLGPPDGFIRSPDIDAAVDSYHHDCTDWERPPTRPQP